MKGHCGAWESVPADTLARVASQLLEEKSHLALWTISCPQSAMNLMFQVFGMWEEENQEKSHTTTGTQTNSSQGGPSQDSNPKPHNCFI